MAQGPLATGGSSSSGVLQTLQTSWGCTEPEQRGLCRALLGWAPEELMSLGAPKIPHHPVRANHAEICSWGLVCLQPSCSRGTKEAPK